MKRLVFVDVDDTLVTPPYEAVKRAGRLLGKTFPPEEAFRNRSAIHFYDAFPELFRTPNEMWLLALISIPFGQFESLHPMPFDLKQMSAVLADHRVYLISKNPPSFTRWRVRRLEKIFSVSLGDRYIACGPMFKKGPSKVEVIKDIAQARGVALEDCLLIDDSPENLFDAAKSGARGLLVRSTWNLDSAKELASLTPPVASITTNDLPRVIEAHLDTLSVAAPPLYYFVPALTVSNSLRLACAFTKRSWLYRENMPRPSAIVPVARNPLLSLFLSDAHAPIRKRIEDVLAQDSTLKSSRILSIKGKSRSSLMPIDIGEQLKAATAPGRIRKLRAVCKTSLEAYGNRFVRDPLFFFDGFTRKEEMERIVRSERVQQAMSAFCKTHNVTMDAAKEKAKTYVAQIACGRTYRRCAIGSQGLDAILKKVLKRIHVQAHPDISKLGPDCFIVYAATHRSYLDSVILFAVLHRQSEHFPFVVGADKMRRVWIGRLGIHGGTFFLQRKFVDVIYAAILKEHISRMQTGGSSIEVFLEGQRSRSGMTLPPKRGIASIIWQNMGDKNVEARKVAIVPVSFAYNKLPESELLIRESFEERKKNEGVTLREEADIKIKAKKRKSRLQTIRSLARRVLSGAISEVYINFAEPIVLQRPAAASEAQSTQKLQGYLNKTMFSINANTTTLPSSILCLGLLSVHDHHMSRSAAASWIDVSRDILALYDERSGQRVLREHSTETHIDAFLKLPFVNRKFKRHRVEETDILSLADLDLQRTIYYKNNVVHFFALPALLAVALIDSKSGRTNELHRFFDHMFIKLQDKYFLPATANAASFIDGLLSVFQHCGFLTIERDRYAVTEPLADDSAFKILANLASEVMKDDVTNILTALKRTYKRHDVSLPSKLSLLVRQTDEPAEVLSLTEGNFFLKCSGRPYVGDQVDFFRHESADVHLSGVVVAQEPDGVAVRIESNGQDSSGFEAEQLRELPQSVRGIFALSRALHCFGDITNLSASGAFIKTDLQLEAGDIVVSHIESSGVTLCIKGKVTRTADSGVGVQFHELTEQAKAQLQVIISELEADSDMASSKRRSKQKGGAANG